MIVILMIVNLRDIYVIKMTNFTTGNDKDRKTNMSRKYERRKKINSLHG